MTIDKLIIRMMWLILILAAIFLSTSCEEYDIDITNNFYLNSQGDTIYIDTTPPPRNYCAAVYFDVYIGDSGLVSINAYPDSMQYLMSYEWTFKGRLFGEEFNRYTWDLVEQLPYRDEYWEVRLEVTYSGNADNVGCGGLIVRAINTYNGYISQREYFEM